ncbi:hypothetical protein OAU50_08055 [Planctomycetota bacterium]|nr:hypothetical protein [Planctomycetota bacterium]
MGFLKLLLIGLLAAFVLSACGPEPNNSNALANSPVKKSEAELLEERSLNLAKWNKAKTELELLHKAILMFVLEHDGDLPKSLDDLTESYPDGLPKDPFTKTNYTYELREYTLDGLVFTLRCLGSDGAEGGLDPPEADIVFDRAGFITADTDDDHSPEPKFR